MRSSSVPSIEDLITQLQAKQHTIADYIDHLTNTGEPDPSILSAIDLFRQNTATLGRLLKTRQELGGQDAGLAAAINAALDEVANDLGVQL